MLAAPLVRALAAAPGLRAFLTHAHERRRQFSAAHGPAEDVVLGYWLARLQRTPPQPLAMARSPQSWALSLAAPVEHVRYVQAPPNTVFNVDCFQSKGMYQAWELHVHRAAAKPHRAAA